MELLGLTIDNDFAHQIFINGSNYPFTVFDLSMSPDNEYVMCNMKSNDNKLLLVSIKTVAILAVIQTALTKKEWLGHKTQPSDHEEYQQKVRKLVDKTLEELEEGEGWKN